MKNDHENAMNAVLERIARGYDVAKRDWQSDRRNAFKDGRLLAYYEVQQAALSCPDADDALDVLTARIARGYDLAERDWKADRRNPFKDGKLLAYYEMTRLTPAC